MEIREGWIAAYKNDRGFGFVHSPVDSKDSGKLLRCFFHISQWLGDQDPAANMKVRFVLTETAKGFQASAVEPIAAYSVRYENEVTS